MTVVMSELDDVTAVSSVNLARVVLLDCGRLAVSML